MLDPKILIFILLLVLFYFVFSYQENFITSVKDYQLDGRCVNKNEIDIPDFRYYCNVLERKVNHCDVETPSGPKLGMECVDRKLFI